MKAARQIGVGRAQVGHHQQGLAAGGQLAPAGRTLAAVMAKGIGEHAERARVGTVIPDG
jgi:hypothetical protein